MQISEWRKHFGYRLQTRAMQLGLKGAEVARLAGLNPKAYNNYVNSRRLPALYELPRIAAALETTLYQLLDVRSMLSTRDERTYRSMQRLDRAALELTPEDIDLLADVAEATTWRRRNEERREVRPSRLSLAYESLIPAIIEGFPSVPFETWTQDNSDLDKCLRISLTFRKGSNLKGLIADLTRLTMERMGVQREELSVTRTSQAIDGVNVMITVRLDRPSKQAADCPPRSQPIGARAIWRQAKQARHCSAPLIGRRCLTGR